MPELGFEQVAGLLSPCSNPSPLQFLTGLGITGVRTSSFFNLCPKQETLDFSPSSFLQNPIALFLVSNLNPSFGAFPLVSLGRGEEDWSLSRSTYTECVRWPLLSHCVLPPVLPLIPTRTDVSGAGPAFVLRSGQDFPKCCKRSCPPYLWGIHSKTPRGCPQPRIVPNPVGNCFSPTHTYFFT